MVADTPTSHIILQYSLYFAPYIKLVWNRMYKHNLMMMMNIPLSWKWKGDETGEISMNNNLQHTYPGNGLWLLIFNKRVINCDTLSAGVVIAILLTMWKVGRVAKTSGTQKNQWLRILTWALTSGLPYTISIIRTWTSFDWRVTGKMHDYFINGAWSIIINKLCIWNAKH